MARFDRQATEGGDLPALLGTATEEFRRSLERHVQRIVEVANGQAAEIERDAERKARQKQEQSDLRAEEAIQGVITRASSVLDSIELVQTAISGMLADLRAEVKNLEAGAARGELKGSPGKPQGIGQQPDQRLAKRPPGLETQPGPQAPRPAEPLRPPQPARPADTQAAARKEPPAPVATPSAPKPAATPKPAAAPKPEPTAEVKPGQPSALAGAQTQEKTPQARPVDIPLASKAPPSPKEQPATEAQPPTEAEPPKQKAQPDQNADSSAEFDQMIHGEIRRMFEGGKPRGDVERFLERLELGDNYAGLLDELYSEGSGRRRKLFGRRRDR